MCISGKEQHALAPGQATRIAVDVASGTRSAHIYYPASAGRNGLPALLFAFHGGGSTAEQMMAFSGLNEKAEKEAFVVVYPNGSGRTEKYRSWNAGRCCGYAAHYQVDDIDFVTRLFDKLLDSLAIDPARVYATGMSNGGMFSYRLACRMPDRLAAVCAVAGALVTEPRPLDKPVPVLHFHGTEDHYVPYLGGKARRNLGRTDFPSVAETIEHWRQMNGCLTEPQSTILPRSRDRDLTIRQDVYRSESNSAEVILVTIEGAGHTWPGRHTELKALGRTTCDVSANDMMWTFFQRHVR